MIYAAKNVIGLLHDEDPARWRLPTQGFVIDPQPLAASQHWIRQGWHLAAIYHSHPSGARDFSPEDVRQALGPKGRPALPKVVHLVLALASRTDDPSLTAWQWDGRRFAKRDVVLVDPPPQAHADTSPLAI